MAKGDDMTHGRTEQPARVVVAFELAADEVKARALAAELGLSDVVRFDGVVAGDPVLVLGGAGLALREGGCARQRGLRVDFVEGATAYRRRTGYSRRQPLARAVGVKGHDYRVVDATVGLGQDSFLLACLGCRVTAIERSPIMAALLQDGLSRALKTGDAKLRSVVERIDLIVADAREWLRGLPEGDAPDAVYMDPMYPARRKSALPTRKMRLCRMLVGDDPDAADLLDAARRVGCRVAVKRHRLAPPVAEDIAATIEGTAVRYDIYLTPP